MASVASTKKAEDMVGLWAVRKADTGEGWSGLVQEVADALDEAIAEGQRSTRPTSLPSDKKPCPKCRGRLNGCLVCSHTGLVAVGFAE